ncbi:hypothetical protein E8D34_09970 [Nocardioides sp. GY 10113]|uniref:carboxypeptidase regulatory-like domain-containing protein n=1 Tax=Nocardioides sp. GY 10113 TaxID=2569761 RepID=UPI0010A772BE|nr:carboxypeptidase regulatory-like domain-containing protein [Nocardioides sp. GY 10113]TIC87444.1 hypothetical protein E8D34_09970 [Nocardioides sp. GY 10113]
MQRPHPGTDNRRRGAAVRRLAGLVAVLMLAAVVEAAGLARPAAATTDHTGTLAGEVAYYVAGTPMECDPADPFCVTYVGGSPGDPIAGVTVEARSTDAPDDVVGTATTDAEGRFSMVVPLGRDGGGDYYLDEFQLHFSAEAIEDGWWLANPEALTAAQADASTVGLGQGSTSSVIALAQPAPTPVVPGDVTGTVVTAQDAPVAGADVTVWRQPAGGDWEAAATDTTDADGAYAITFAEVDPEAAYTVSATKDGVTVYAGNVATLELASVVTLTGPHTFAALTLTTADVAVAKKRATLNVRAIGRTRAAKVIVRLSLDGRATDRVTGRVKVAVSGAKAVTAKVRSGRATVLVRKLKKGKHTVTVSYAGTKVYRSARKRTTVRVR